MPQPKDVELTPTQIKLNDEFQQIIKTMKKDEKELLANQIASQIS